MSALWVSLLAAACSADVATARAEDLVGEFRYVDGVAACQELGIAYPLSGLEASIARQGEGLAFSAGPGCGFPLVLSGDGAEIQGEVQCEFLFRVSSCTAHVAAFRIVQRPDGTFENTASGRARVVVKRADEGMDQETPIDCEHFSFDGARLARASP